MDRDFEPHHLLGPGGHPVVEADLVVAVRVSFLRVRALRLLDGVVNQFAPGLEIMID